MNLDNIQIAEFSPLENPILLNIISSILWVLLGVISYKVTNFIKTRRNFFCRFFFNSLSPRNNILLINASISKIISRRKIHFLEEGDAKALNEVYGFTSEFRKKDKIKILKHSDAISEIESISNFITISGPIYNSVTEQYLKKIQCPFIFNREKKSIDFNNNSFTTTYHEDKTIDVCHGIIILGTTTTLKGNKQRFMILAGNSSISTYTSTLILQRIAVDKEFRKSIKNSIKKCNENWGILFKVENCKNKSAKDFFSNMTLKYEVLKTLDLPKK